MHVLLTLAGNTSCSVRRDTRLCDCCLCSQLTRVLVQRVFVSNVQLSELRRALPPACAAAAAEPLPRKAMRSAEPLARCLDMAASSTRAGSQPYRAEWVGWTDERLEGVPAEQRAEYQRHATWENTQIASEREVGAGPSNPGAASSCSQAPSHSPVLEDKCECRDFTHVRHGCGTGPTHAHPQRYTQL